LNRNCDDILPFTEQSFKAARDNITIQIYDKLRIIKNPEKLIIPGIFLLRFFAVWRAGTNHFRAIWDLANGVENST